MEEMYIVHYDYQPDGVGFDTDYEAEEFAKTKTVAFVEHCYKNGEYDEWHDTYSELFFGGEKVMSSPMSLFFRYERLCREVFQ